MADGYRFPQQSGGNYYYPQHNQNHSRHLARNGSPSNVIRPGFTSDLSSPSRSPDNNSPAPAYGMFGQNQGQGQHGRVNGGGRAMPMMHNYPYQNNHHPQQNQHHQGHQQDHIGNGTGLGHHPSYSSGLSGSTPTFTAAAIHNGHNTTTRGGQAQLISESWAEQLKLYEESKRAHLEMRPADGGDRKPNYYARMKQARAMTLTSEMTNLSLKSNPEEEPEDPGRPSNLAKAVVKRQDWLNLDLSGHWFKSLANSIFKYSFLQDLYIASNLLTSIPPAIGELRQLRHLDASYNMLDSLPPELGMCVYLKQLLLFNNKIQALPNELGSLYSLEMLGIEGNPMSQSLGVRQKEMLASEGTQAMIRQLREDTPPPLPPAPRQIISLEKDGPILPNQERLKVFSYNTLCDRYATTSQYGYTPTNALSWEYRKEMILAEIKASKADFICLQEIEHDSYDEFFRSELAYFDYKGVFWPKMRARTMSEKDRKRVDGCATFYKDNKYLLLDKQLIDISNIAINRPDMKKENDIFNRVMPRDNIGVVTFFENRLTGTRFFVVNAHIYYDAAFADVKVIQTAIIVEYLVKISEKYARWPAQKDKKRIKLTDTSDGADGSEEVEVEPAPSQEYTSTQIPLIMCSDLNSLPDSGVYELLANGKIPGNHKDLANHSYGNFTRDGIQHPFALRSAYANLDDTPSLRVPYTNYTPGFTGVIDYIWYSTNALEVTELLGAADTEYMKRVPGWPTYHFPSDHLALQAEFVVRGVRKEKKAQAQGSSTPASSSEPERRS